MQNEYQVPPIPPQAPPQSNPQPGVSATTYPYDQSPVAAAAQQAVPSILGKWNWGAFLLSWVWGVFNGAYLSLLCLVPFLNVVWLFVTGFKGNEWAWNSGKFHTVEEFEEKQRQWTKWGIIIAAISIGLNILVWGAYFVLVILLVTAQQ